MLPSRSIVFTLLPLALAFAAHAQDPTPSASPGPTVSFPSEVELVTVDAVVTDKKGNPATGLTREDFTVTEDGKPQSIVSFESVRLPDKPPETIPVRPRVSVNTSPEARSGRSFVVVFDDVHLTPAQAHRAKPAVASFLQKGTREGDRVSVVATGGGAWWSSRMLAGRDELVALLKRLDGRHIADRGPDRITEYEAMRIHVFRDTQLEQTVSRRFDTYGARATAGSVDDRYQSGDPLVRARATDVYFQSVSRNRITLQVLERVLLSLASTRGRKSLILVSQGFIFDPNLDEFKRVLQASRRANVAIYFLDTRGLDGVPVELSAEFGPAVEDQDIGNAFMNTLEEAAGSESLALDSGGFVVKNTNDLAGGIGRIADDSRSYYLLGYNPSDQRRDGRFRKISVKLRTRGLQVRARKGYYAPLEGGQSKAELAPGSADPDIQAALDSPYEEVQVPLRMTSYVFDETLLGKANVVVATDVDMRTFGFKEEDGRFVDKLEYLLVVAHRESGEYFRYDEKVDMKLLPATRDKLAATWYTVAKDFELAPGGYQAKIVVRDKNNGHLGTVIHDFEVPALGGLRTSTPLLSDQLHQPPADRQGSPRAAMLVRRSFAPGATLYCQFEVYGAQKEKASGMPKVTAGYEIRQLGGATFSQVAPTLITPTSLGRLSRIVGTPLEGAVPGDYELVLQLRDLVADKAIEVREPFSVAAAAGTAPEPSAPPAQ